MGKGRWMYSNLISAATMITASSAETGVVGSVVAEASGSAVMSAQGDFSGETDTKYTIQIDDVSGGAEVGSATFRWKKGDSTTWEASGVTTSSSLLALDNGVQIKWTSGAGDDFSQGDTWTLWASRSHGKARLIDRDPNTDWRATGCTDETLTMDLGSAQNITAVILDHHNLSSGATITLMANSANSWGAPAYSQALTWATRHVGYFLDQTYRYWRVRIQDAGNTDGYARLAGLFLGTYLEPSRNYSTSHQRDVNYNTTPQTDGGNLTGATYAGKAESFSLSYDGATTTDYTNLKAMFDALHDLGERRAYPCWFCPDSASPSDLIFGLFDGTLPRAPRNPTGSILSVQLTLDEIPRTADA